jgi:hypothetical protein
MTRTLWIAALLLLNTSITAFASVPERNAFYAAMKSQDIKTVDVQLELLEKDSSSDNAAFQGALLMKKAGLVKGPFKKLKLFKQGHSSLEAALEKNSNDPEIRFLRLMIQENAPGILNYNDDIKSDVAAIQVAFKNMPEDLRQIILEYSKTSHALTPAALTG